MSDTLAGPPTAETVPPAESPCAPWKDASSPIWRRAGRRTVGHAPLTISPREYTDPVRFEAEKRELFGKIPLLAGLSCEVANPGDVMLFDSAGPAILIVRNRDGVLNAFLNMCTHRASRLVNACSRRKLITCPFHAWSFDLDGKLVGSRARRPSRGSTGPRAAWSGCRSAEWGGMVFVKAHAGEETIDVEAWLGAMGPHLLNFNLAGASLVKHSRVDVDASWKYALDTYGEGYHFASLHPTTFGVTTVSNVILYDHFDPHYRVTSPTSPTRT